MRGSLQSAAGRRIVVPNTSMKVSRFALAAHAPRTVPTLRPASAQNWEAGSFLPSSNLSMSTSMWPPCAVTKMPLSLIAAMAPMPPLTCEKVRTGCLRASNNCSFLPFNVVQAPGAGLQ